MKENKKTHFIWNSFFVWQKCSSSLLPPHLSFFSSPSLILLLPSFPAPLLQPASPTERLVKLHSPRNPNWVRFSELSPTPIRCQSSLEPPSSYSYLSVTPTLVCTFSLHIYPSFPSYTLIIRPLRSHSLSTSRS